MPWLDAADEPTLRAWAELELLAAGAFADLTVRGATSDSGEPRRLLNDYRLLRTAALSHAQALGMTPASRMALQVGDSRARAFDAASDHLSEGRRLRLAAEARQSRSKT